MDCYNEHWTQSASNAIREIYFVNSFIAIDDSSLSIGNNVGALVEHTQQWM